MRALALFALLLTAGCSTNPLTTSANAGFNFLVFDVVSVVTTDKTLFDHLMTAVMDEDCSSVRVEQGGPYCKPWEKPYIPLAEPPRYCYRTLGEITCYTSPDLVDSGAYVGGITPLTPQAQPLPPSSPAGPFPVPGAPAHPRTMVPAPYVSDPSGEPQPGTL